MQGLDELEVVHVHVFVALEVCENVPAHEVDEPVAGSKFAKPGHPCVGVVIVGPLLALLLEEVLLVVEDVLPAVQRVFWVVATAGAGVLVTLRAGVL